MKLKYLIPVAFLGLAIISCKHEIIPAPEHRVDLTCHFQGNINNSPVEFTQFIDGYDMDANKTKTILPNAFSRATYYSRMYSNQKNIYIKLIVGEALWDGSQNDDPSIEAFTNLFKNYPNPVYNANGAQIPGNPSSCFDMQYKDNEGNLWTLDPNQTQTLNFTYLSQESDRTGDYMKYIAKFDVTFTRTWWDYQYNSLGVLIDSTENTGSFTITQGVLTGWFKR